MCRAHAAVRHLLGGILEAEHPVTIVDMEAGLEHLSRGTGRHVDTLLVTLEPYYKALETARRSAELGRELGISAVLAVANKLRDEQDASAVRDFASAHKLVVEAEIPFDDALRRADMMGVAPLDAGLSPAVCAIAALADSLLTRAAA
jgi:CO dehydrogenase maturation factor